jgi:alkyldihydroxyacetonephosphate synthase
MAEMKWWGWGLEGAEFTHADMPGLAPFIERVLGLDVRCVTAPPPSFASLCIPDSMLPAALRSELEQTLGPDHVSMDELDRVVHGRGKSLRDLIRQRRGDLPRVPDVVVRPANEEQVAAVLRSAVTQDAVVIPFGGGSSISGSLEPAPAQTRPVISVDLSRLDAVLEVDRLSGLARVQAGVLGPALEDQLRGHGYTLGHVPDSFTHSTLGGWIATRSSGMQSDRYGDIADLTKGVRVVTPSGTLVVRPIPAMSAGPSVREMILGSEGRLGIITEATMQVRRLPEQRTILGYLFPCFADGLAAMQEIAHSECSVSVTRV